jgi:hypothetical protein
MIPVKPLYVELTQPLQQDLPGQRASNEERRDPLTRELTRSLTPTPLDAGLAGDDAENDA